MSKTTIAYVKLVRDEHGTIIHSENADHLFVAPIGTHREVRPWVTKLVGDAVAAEREACANVCDAIYHQNIGLGLGEVRYGIAACASGIRARK